MSLFQATANGSFIQPTTAHFLSKSNGLFFLSPTKIYGSAMKYLLLAAGSLLLPGLSAFAFPRVEPDPSFRNRRLPIRIVEETNEGGGFLASVAGPVKGCGQKPLSKVGDTFLSMEKEKTG